MALTTFFSQAWAQGAGVSSNQRSGSTADESAPANISRSCEADISQSIRDEDYLTSSQDMKPHLPSPDFETARERSNDNYVKTIELAHLSWPGNGGSDGKLDGRLLIGFRRPYYSLKKIVQLAGSFDVKIDGIFRGLTNSAKLTVKYDFARTLEYNSTSMKFYIDNMTFKIGIPFVLPYRI